MPITTKEDALTLALALAITATDENKAAQCIAMAEQFASGLTLAQVNACKQAAQNMAGAEI